jgi:hypothetical protein
MQLLVMQFSALSITSFPFGPNVFLTILFSNIIIIKVRRTRSSGIFSTRYQLNMRFGTLYRVALFRIDVSENVLCPSSGVSRLMGFHSHRRQLQLIPP